VSDELEWIAVKDDFVAGDVIRWTENIWSEQKFGKRKSKNPKLTGKQQVTGQIEEIEDDLITIRVIAAEIIENTTAKAREPYKREEIIRKKPRTLTKGNAARLPWEEEEFRSAASGEKKLKPEVKIRSGFSGFEKK